MTVRSDRFHVGLAGTTAQQFDIRTPDIPDGSLIIERSDGTQVVKVNADGGATLAVPAFKARKTAASQNLAAQAYVKLQTDVEDIDTHNFYNNTNTTVTLNGLPVLPYCFCPDIAGWYRFTMFVTIGATANNSEAIIRIIKNSALEESWAASQIITSINARTTPSLSDLIYLNGKGDYVQFEVYSTLAGQVIAPRNTITGVLERAV